MKTNSASDLMNLKNAVIMEFCTPNGSAGPKELLENEKRRRRVDRWCDKFIDGMLGPKPYQSEEEAIGAIAPVAVWFIGWAVRQLAIAVLRSLWKRWNER